MFFDMKKSENSDKIGLEKIKYRDKWWFSNSKFFRQKESQVSITMIQNQLHLQENSKIPN